MKPIELIGNVTALQGEKHENKLIPSHELDRQLTQGGPQWSLHNSTSPKMWEESLMAIHRQCWANKGHNLNTRKQILGYVANNVSTFLLMGHQLLQLLATLAT